MAKHIGIVACSAEGAALCYRTICTEAPALMGEHTHPEITLHTHPLNEYMKHIYDGDWEGVGNMMISSVRRLHEAGADFAIAPDNTIHQAFDMVTAESPIPWLHIADSVAGEAARRGYKELGITGTKYLATGPVYPSRLQKFGLRWRIPEEPDRERINEVIMDELVNGVVREPSRRYLNSVIFKLREGGCNAVVLGCTELPLLVDPDDCPLPVLDSTRLLARAALEEALR